MRIPALWVSRLGLLTGVLGALWLGGHLPAQETSGRPAPATSLAQGVPWDEVPAQYRDGVRRVLEKPLLATEGPTEVFHGHPVLYRWFLDHPDRASRIWRRMGAKCLELQDRGNGRFGWADDQGSDVHWDTVYQSAHLRVWYADGQASPGPLLPTVPVRAVAILHYADCPDAQGRTLIHHKAELYVQTDSKTAELVTRLLGPSAPHLARQCVSQMELFFSAIIWYLDKHPDRAQALLFGDLPPGSPAEQDLRRRLSDASATQATPAPADPKSDAG